MSLPAYRPTPLPAAKPHTFDTSAQQIELLKSALIEAATIILRCISEDADFDGDAEEFASSLLDLATPN